MKNTLCLFDRTLKENNNGVFFFRIFTFSRDIEVFAKLGINNVLQGKKQNDTHFDVAMVLISASVRFCYEPNDLNFRPDNGRQIVLIERHEVLILPYISSPAHWE